MDTCGATHEHVAVDVLRKKKKTTRQTNKGQLFTRRESRLNREHPPAHKHSNITHTSYERNNGRKTEATPNTPPNKQAQGLNEIAGKSLITLRAARPLSSQNAKSTQHYLNASVCRAPTSEGRKRSPVRGIQDRIKHTDPVRWYAVYQRVDSTTSQFAGTQHQSGDGTTSPFAGTQHHGRDSTKSPFAGTQHQSGDSTKAPFAGSSRRCSSIIIVQNGSRRAGKSVNKKKNILANQEHLSMSSLAVDLHPQSHGHPRPLTPTLTPMCTRRVHQTGVSTIYLSIERHKQRNPCPRVFSHPHRNPAIFDLYSLNRIENLRLSNGTHGEEKGEAHRGGGVGGGAHVKYASSPQH